MGVRRVFGSFENLGEFLWEVHESFGGFDRTSEFKKFRVVDSKFQELWDLLGVFGNSR